MPPAKAKYAWPSDLDSDDEGSIDDYEEEYEVESSDFDEEGDTRLLVDAVDGLRISAPHPHRSAPHRRHGSRIRDDEPLPDPLCIVCEERPQFNRSGKRYPTCGLRCAAKLESGEWEPPRRSRPLKKKAKRRGAVRDYVLPEKPDCVICKTKKVYGELVTCGFGCAEKLCKDGGDPTMCDYCHRAPRLQGKTQCGPVCEEKAKIACLFCRCRPKNKRYHFCGKTCKQIATKITPLIREIPEGHSSYEMVKKRFTSGWKAGGTPIPTIKKIYKIIEDDEFLRPYEKYKKSVGNEHFRYHGTGRQCQLGTTTTELCTSATCSVCNILRTSFKIALAKTSGAFGPGVYSSSASNKAFSYCGTNGAMLLTKVVLGTIRTVQGWNEVMACPPGFNSVVFDRMNGNLNETIVYSDDAIRPVFLITF